MLIYANKNTIPNDSYFKEQVNEWTKKIRKEGYQLDRQINAIKREELKVSCLNYLSIE